MANVQTIAVVIADDDEDDFWMIKGAIADLHSDYEVTFVENGVKLIEHLDYLDRNNLKFPDLILLDINMPMKDGKETLREISASPKYQRIPVVMLTSSRLREDIESCYRLGAAGYLTKPYSMSELERKIKIVLEYWLETVEHPILD